MKENSIQEDIKILEEMIENANIENMDMNDCFGGEHIEAIEHILSDYKRLLKENEELKRKNEELKVLEDDVQDKNIAYIDEPEFEEKYMPKQKIKDKIEELNNNRQYLSQFKDYKEKDYTNEEVVNNCVEVLQELIEEEK